MTSVARLHRRIDTIRDTALLLIEDAHARIAALTPADPPSEEDEVIPDGALHRAALSTDDDGSVETGIDPTMVTDALERLRTA